MDNMGCKRMCVTGSKTREEVAELASIEALYLGTAYSLGNRVQKGRDKVYSVLSSGREQRCKGGHVE